MKNRLLAGLVFLCGLAGVHAQVQGSGVTQGFVQTEPVYLSAEEYHQRKVAGTLTGNEVPLESGMVNPGDLDNAKHYVSSLSIEKATGCSGYFPPTTPAVTLPTNNDDFSLAPISLPFQFCFYGTNYNTVYFNGNGNISFVGGITTFTPTAFPSNNNRMIAAFWADFHYEASGSMHYTITPTAAIFNWVDGGYFNAHDDKVNTCQVVITNGSDPLVVGGNVAIHYGDMQWTTGDASGGDEGFGGTAATAGVNRGNNVDYFTIGRFDHAGTDYDGPGGATDGVSFLDNKSYYLNLCNTTGNLDPIPLQTAYCDTLKVCNVGDTLTVSFPWIGPENSQVVTVDYTAPTLTNVNVLSNNPNELTLQIIGSLETVGYHTITVTGEDNFSTPSMVQSEYVIEVVDGSALFPVTPLITYQNTCDSIALTFAPSITNDSLIWSTGSHLNQTTITPQTDGNVTLTFHRGGCKLLVDSLITVTPSIPIDMDGSIFFCPATGGSQLTFPDSNSYTDITWGLPNPARDSMFTNFLTAGTYTVTLTQSGGACTSDTTFTVTSQPPVDLISDTGSCTGIIQMNGNTGGSGTGTWSVVPGAPGTVTFNPPNSMNPNVILSNLGVYYVVYTDAVCGDDDTIQLVYAPTPSFNFTNDFFTCPGQLETMRYNDSLNLISINWGMGAGPGTDYTEQLPIGQHTVTIVTQYGCQADTTFTIVSQPEVNIDDLVTEICGGYIDFNNNTGVQVGQWSSYSSPGSVYFDVPTDLNTSVSITTYGLYHLVFKESTCNDADTAHINFIPFPSVDLNPQMDLCAGQTVELVANNAHPSFTDQLVWSTGATTPSIFVTAADVYYVTVQNTCGTATDSIIITSTLCDINLPNVFTPDGDKMNDTWHLLEISDIFKSFDCVITDRWGTTVFTSTDPAAEWDGKDKSGNALNEGVYFYYIKFTTLADEEITKNGFIHIEK